MFALLLVPMLGFAAIAVDIGALYAERARLQVGADAAAIAVAQDCSRGNCGDMLATAQALITANDTEGTAAQPVLSSDPLSVTVTAAPPRSTGSRRSSGTTPRGLRDGDRRLGGPQRRHRGAPADLLLVLVRGADRRRLPSSTTVQTIKLHQDRTRRMHRAVEQLRPRRFRLPRHRQRALRGDQRHRTSSSLRRPATTRRRAARPADFAAFVGQTVLLPIFDDSGGTGNSAWYRVYGYAAFTITGYDFGGQYNTARSRATAATAASAATSPASSSCPTPGTTAPTPRSWGPPILRLIR